MEGSGIWTVPCQLVFHSLTLFIILPTFTTSTPRFTEDELYRPKRSIICTFIFVQSSVLLFAIMLILSFICLFIFPVFLLNALCVLTTEQLLSK